VLKIDFKDIKKTPNNMFGVFYFYASPAGPKLIGIGG
jgi:hypothetical protein